MSTHYRRNSGFSLVELMIALVAGLIVVGAVLAFTLSSLRSNTDYISATRLTQELRTNMNFVVDELQRSGYDENALDFIAQPVTAAASSEFNRIQIADSDGDGMTDCVVYAYDRQPGNAGVVEQTNGEIRALRRSVVPGGTVGVIEFAESIAGMTPTCGGGAVDYTTYPATCNAGSGWCALSDHRVLDVTTLRFNNSNFVQLPGNVASGLSPMQIRRIGVEMVGRLQGIPDTEIRRGLRSEIRVRADCIRANPAANCTVSPTGT